jgi:hypothetical protein
VGFFTTYPDNYLALNKSTQKQLNVVFEMDGASDELFSLALTKKTILWGDPGLFWGDDGLVWGGTAKDGRVKEYILTESNLQISQQVEPEQGRGSVSTMSFTFLDLNGEVTRFFSPGQVVNEPLGNKLCRVRVGYSETSYPQDYFTIFRGYISAIRSVPNKIIAQMSDPNAKTRGQLFYMPSTTTTAFLAASDTTVTVETTADFPQQIMGPDGSYDSGISTYALVGSEYIGYGPSASDVTDTQFLNVIRGQLGSVAASDDIGATAAGIAQVQDNFLNIALKVCLSGWNGPWKTGVKIQSIRTLSTGDVANAIELPFGFDAVEDYGLTAGDYVYISNSTAGNDGTYIVSGISSVDDQPNNVILLTTDLPSPEDGATGVTMSFRSKYDVYPMAMGMKLTPADIDVSVFEYFRDVFFNADQYRMRFVVDSPISGKQWLESQLFLPCGCYSITRKGKLAVNLALPPIGDSGTQIVDRSNIINGDSMSIERAINTRRYFNEIQYQYDKDPQTGDYDNTRVIIDSESLSNISISTVLPIPADGLRTDLDADVLIDRQGQLLIQRYRDAALYLECQVNWTVGSVIETGDTVIFNDNGQLMVANFATGERNLGSVLFEVIKCVKDIKGGKVTLGLLSGLQYLTTDRFGTVTPSSYVIASDSDAGNIAIQPSFGQLYGSAEWRKWTDSVQGHISIHPTDYSQYYESRLVSVDPITNKLMVSPAFPVSPSDGWVVDIAFYPTDSDPTTNELQKKAFAFFSPDVIVVCDVSLSEVVVGSSDADKFIVGNPIYYHSYDYSVISTETLIAGVSGNHITVSPAFDVTPSGQGRLGLIGYRDGGQPYRYV